MNKKQEELIKKLKKELCEKVAGMLELDKDIDLIKRVNERKSAYEYMCGEEGHICSSCEKIDKIVKEVLKWKIKKDLCF